MPNKQWAAEVARMTTILAEVFRQKATDTIVEAYQIGLDGLTLDEVRQAFKESLQTSRFMPSPAEMREMLPGPSMYKPLTTKCSEA